jgi:phage major head subunit gpT-like protein
MALADLRTTGRVTKTVLPDLYDLRIKQAWLQGYGESPHQYEPYFIMQNTENQEVRSSYVSGLGLWVEKAMGESVSFDSIYQGYDTTITPYTYNLAVSLEQETVEDDPHGILGQQIATNLAQTGRYTIEYLAASAITGGFAAAYASPWMSSTSGDLKTLFAPDHPILSGGTYGNNPVTEVDFGITPLQDACLRMRKMQNTRGLLWPMEPKNLVVPPDLEYSCREVLESTQAPYTANNQINVMKGALNLSVWSYMTDSDMWMVNAGKPASVGGNGFATVAVWRIKPEFDRDNHFETGDRRYKGRMRVGFGWYDWRGWDGSQGI